MDTFELEWGSPLEEIDLHGCYRGGRLPGAGLPAPQVLAQLDLAA